MRPFSYCKLEIFLPASHLSPLETALRQVDAGPMTAVCPIPRSPAVGAPWREPPHIWEPKGPSAGSKS